MSISSGCLETYLNFGFRMWESKQATLFSERDLAVGQEIRCKSTIFRGNKLSQLLPSQVQPRSPHSPRLPTTFFGAGLSGP
uniref:Uncharacterized protein n=1 Tax=Zea mays TaxID=4577 RepID=C4J0E8_MAIZE|nr:unknown [Zea mays]